VREVLTTDVAGRPAVVAVQATETDRYPNLGFAVWSLPAGEPIVDRMSPGQTVTLDLATATVDGTVVVALGADGPIQMYEAATGRPVGSRIEPGVPTNVIAAVDREAAPVLVAGFAQWKAQIAARRPKPAKLASNPRLQDYVQTRLSGQLQYPDGTVAAGPPTTWKGLNKPHRADRRWATAWSPEQISRRLVLDFPDDVNMRISHEAIYQALFIQGRGALKRELVACLRTGRALRKPRERSRNKPQGHVTADVVFSANGPPRPRTGQSPVTGRATSSSG
jgi:hypothetical protein